MRARLSFQLYSSRNTDLSAMLAHLAAKGFQEVEGFGGVYNEPPHLHQLLVKHGLTMPSGHFGLDDLERNTPAVLKTARTLGINTVIAPWLDAADRPANSSGWRALGKRLNTLAQRYRSEGMAFAWHNHDFEFLPLADGSLPHDVMFEAAPQMDWEIDVAWVARAGQDPVATIARYASIITHAHVKDIAQPGTNQDQDGWTNIGQGTINWQACITALKASRCMHWILEHDNPANAMDFATHSITAVNSIWEATYGK